jgi:hypothetical protein
MNVALNFVYHVSYFLLWRLRYLIGHEDILVFTSSLIGTFYVELCETDVAVNIFIKLFSSQTVYFRKYNDTCI